MNDAQRASFTHPNCTDARFPLSFFAVIAGCAQSTRLANASLAEPSLAGARVATHHGAGRAGVDIGMRCTPPAPPRRGSLIATGVAPGSTR